MSRKSYKISNKSVPEVTTANFLEAKKKSLPIIFLKNCEIGWIVSGLSRAQNFWNKKLRKRSSSKTIRSSVRNGRNTLETEDLKKWILRQKVE